MCCWAFLTILSEGIELVFEVLISELNCVKRKKVGVPKANLKSKKDMTIHVIHWGMLIKTFESEGIDRNKSFLSISSSVVIKRCKNKVQIHHESTEFVTYVLFRFELTS